VKRAVALAGRLTGKELVTHRVPLEDITDGFRRLRDRSGDPIKMVLIP
jgi:L-iditol 2-dehydrogenase